MARSQSNVDRDLEAVISGCRKHSQLEKCLHSELRVLEKRLKSLRAARVRQVALFAKRQRATQTCSTLMQQAQAAAACVRDGAVWHLGRNDERLADLGIKLHKGGRR